MSSMHVSLDAISQVAKNAAVIGGEKVLESFGHSKILKRKGLYDLQVSADVESEKAIIEYISSEFPHHKFFSEEDENGITSFDGDLWAIDPLEGSNNFALGLPYFGISVSYFRAGVIYLTAIYDPILRNMYFARLNGGAQVNDLPIHVAEETNLRLASISLVNDYSELGRKNGFEILETLGQYCKRPLLMWAPAMDLAQIARGSLDGMICWRGMYLDSCSGLLLVSEAGGIITDLNGNDLPMQTFSFTEPASFIAGSNRAITDGIARVFSKVEVSEGDS